MGRTGAFLRLCGLAALTLLLFPVYGFLREGPSTGALAVVLPVLLVFALLYGWVWFRASDPRPSPLALSAVVVLAALAGALNLALPGTWQWVSLFVYVVAAAGFAWPGRTGLVAVGLTTLLAAITALAEPSVMEELERDLPLSVAAALPQLLLIGFGAAGVRRLIQTTEELRAAQEELARHAVEEERYRFARDLHDLLGHSLSVIALKSELAIRLLPHRPDDAAVEVRDIERVARGGLREVREVVTGYRRANLAGELAAARAALEAAGVECRVEDTAGSLPSEAEAVFAWAVREGVTNVARHSRARRCAIHLARSEGEATATLDIVDDGPVGKPADLGNGLTGLGERVASAGGQVEAGPALPRGFRLRVTLPLTLHEIPRVLTGGGPSDPRPAS